jgi:hypothetical protein
LVVLICAWLVQQVTILIGNQVEAHKDIIQTNKIEEDEDMCQFFSLISNGEGKVYYFDAKQRKAILKGKDKAFKNVETADSHSSISSYFGFTEKKADVVNKYEYNPLTKVFTVDQINAKTDDREQVQKICEGLDFKTIVHELIIKPIINPFTDIKTKKVTKADIFLVKKWASVRASVLDSVRDSVRASVWDSVRDSVGASVRDSVRDSVRASVWDSVGASVWDSVRDSVRDSVGDSVWDSERDSVWDSVWDSVRDSVWAYISSMFNIKVYKYCEEVKYEIGTNPFQPAITLWEKGLVPSFDGTHWRLHGMGGKELWKGKFKPTK